MRLGVGFIERALTIEEGGNTIYLGSAIKIRLQDESRTATFEILSQNPDTVIGIRTHSRQFTVPDGQVFFAIIGEQHHSSLSTCVLVIRR